VGHGKPPRNAGLKKGQSANPRGQPPGSKNLATLLNEAVSITDNAVIKQLVIKSAPSDARSLKILLDLMLKTSRRGREPG
jgi:hypothetical protein